MSVEILAQYDNTCKVLFYPSSGSRIRDLFELPYDLFVLADYGILPGGGSKRSFVSKIMRSVGSHELISLSNHHGLFQVGHKQGLIIFEKNRNVLGMLRESKVSVDCFVGVCDGCVEGGNDECVNDLDFLSQVIELSSSTSMLYLTDHSRLLSNTFPNSGHLDKSDDVRHEVIFRGKYLEYLGNSERKISFSSWGPICKFRVTPHIRTVRKWSGIGPQVTLEHDTIADYLSELSGVFISCRCRRLFLPFLNRFFEGAPNYYFKPSLRRGWSTAKSMASLLELCIKMKWKVVGTTAFGEGNHRDMIKVLECWKEEYPKSVRIFHYDRDDFADIDNLFIEIDQIF